MASVDEIAQRRTKEAIKRAPGKLLETAGKTFRNLQKNERQKRLEFWKAALGTGFRSNLWVAEIDFNRAYSVQSETNVYFTIKDFFITYSGSESLSPLYEEFNSQKKWFGLCNKVQIPGLDMETTQVYRDRKRIKGVTKGALTAGFLNDQWNANWTFWYAYFNSISNMETHTTQLELYPEEYLFNVTVTLLTSQQEKYQQFIFKNVYPTKLPDVDLNYDAVDSIPTLDLSFDYETIEMTALTTLEVKQYAWPTFGKFYRKEIEYSMKLKANSIDKFALAKNVADTAQDTYKKWIKR